MSKPLDDKVQFRIELFLALIITGLACCAGLSNLLFAPNDLYPGATDYIGHMAKIQYITECLKEGHIPSWYPYWYNGTAATQYYPPLSYYLTVPIYAVTGNVMITFKIHGILTVLIGGMGIWYFCRTYIGRWCGLTGSIVFCLQPFILQTLYSEGQIAQGPIIALTPWYLFLIFEYSQKPTSKKFFLCTVICSLMILSHANSIFMFCICILLALALMLPLKGITLLTFFYLGLSIVFAGILTAFWSLVGVTGLENPGIPYLNGEAVSLFTANFDWFLHPYKGFFYFAIPISIGCILAMLVFAYFISTKKMNHNQIYNFMFIALITVISIALSFGHQLPFFRFIPMSGSFMPARILNLSSITAAILCAYLLYGIQTSVRNKKTSTKLFAVAVNLTIVISLVIFINPFGHQFSVRNDACFKEMISPIDSRGQNYEKGRYMFIGTYDSSQTFFPLLYNYNISEGFNIEGTVHNQEIRNAILANASGNLNYIAKNLAFWNVRYLLLQKNYERTVVEINKKYNFRVQNNQSGSKFYSSDDPSSYFLVDKRNALILGAGSPGIAIEFPCLVQGRSENIMDYAINELGNYKMIYLCEPEVNTLQDKKGIEDIIRKLIDKGITVVIEPTNMSKFPLFDVTASDVVLEETPIIKKQSGSKIKDAADMIPVDKKVGYARALFGLDKVYYKLIENDGSLKNSIIGTKKVSNGEVVFIGMHLSQYLKAVYTRNFGAPQNNNAAYYPICSNDVKVLFADIFKTYNVNTNFWPDSFPVEKADWNYKGVTFKYNSPKSKDVTISVTYTPRWKATIDGKPVEVGQRENLITIKLPAGNHQVKLVYGITKYGEIGYGISLTGLLLFLLFLKFYDIILDKFGQVILNFGKFLQIYQND